jgi:hypothetical protein
MKQLSLRVGGMYSNGIFGRHWAVRQVLAFHAVDEGAASLQVVTFKVLAGPERRKRLTCSREEFTRWAVYEVARNENSWTRCDDATSKVIDHAPHEG